MDRIVAMAFAIIFEELKDRKKAAKMRAVLFKMYRTIETIAVTDDDLGKLIHPKPNA